MEVPSPSDAIESRNEVFCTYLDAFRDEVALLAMSVSEADAARSPLPSGWTILELLQHLRYVELRWLEWGFLGREFTEPWGDRQGSRWHVADGTSRDVLLVELREQGAVTSEIIRTHSLDDQGEQSERWEGGEPPTLERVLFHLLQEYARHVGHLDVVTELEGRPVI